MTRIAAYFRPRPAPTFDEAMVKAAMVRALDRHDAVRGSMDLPEPAPPAAARPVLPTRKPEPAPPLDDCALDILSTCEALRGAVKTIETTATDLAAFKRLLDGGDLLGFAAPGADGTGVTIPASAALTLKQAQLSSEIMAVGVLFARLEGQGETAQRALAAPVPDAKPVAAAPLAPPTAAEAPASPPAGEVDRSPAADAPDAERMAA